MKIIFPANHKVIKLRLPNALILNRFSFWLLKIIFGIKFYPLVKIKFKYIKPLIKKSKEYKGFEIVNIKTRQGETIVISL